MSQNSFSEKAFIEYGIGNELKFLQGRGMENGGSHRP